jgi:hypothetical protein
VNTACPSCGAPQPASRILRALTGRIEARCQSCGKAYSLRLREREDGHCIDLDVAIIGTLCTVFVRSTTLWLLALATCLALMVFRRLRLEPHEN